MRTCFHRWCCLAGLLAAGPAAGAPWVGLEPLFTIGRPTGQSSSLPGWLSTPVEVTTDPAGRIYVGENGSRRMQVFSPAGTLLFLVNQQSINADGSGTRGTFAPAGIVTGPGGEIYVADQGNSRVMVFDEDGDWIRDFGAPSADNGLSGPTGITLVGNRVYVSEFSTSAIHMFDRLTGLTQGLIIRNQLPFILWSPSSIERDGAGRLFVTDTERDQVHVIDPTAGYLFSFGVRGTARGQLTDPRDVAIAGNGLIYVIGDSAEGRIEVYQPGGAHAFTITADSTGALLAGTTAVHVAGDRLYLTDDVRHRLQVFRILLPEVRIAAAGESRRDEDSAGVISFTISRTGPTVDPLTVSFTVSGSAAAGTDFSIPGTPPYSVVIPAGATSAVVPLTVLADDFEEQDEPVTLTLLPGDFFVIPDGGAAAGVSIGNDDFAPVGVADAGYEVIEDGRLQVAAPAGVLANDTDRDSGGGPANLNAVLVEGTARGVLSLAADGSFTYQPEKDFFGQDLFRYRPSDGTNQGAVIEVPIQVVERVDIAVAVSVIQSPLVAGGAALDTFVVSAVNRGPSKATGLVLRQAADLPADVTLAAANASKGSFVDGNWNIGELDENGTATLTLKVRAGASAAGGTSALPLAFELATAGQVDPDTSNHRGEASTPVIRAADTGLTTLAAAKPARQSGLFVDQVKVTNSNATTVPAFRLHVTNLPPDVTVHNAQGAGPWGEPAQTVSFLLYNQPLAPGEEVDLRVEFLRRSRDPGFRPVYEIELLPVPEADAATGNEGISVTRMMTLPGGDRLIEIASIPGATYAIEYGPDAATWSRVTPLVTATSQRLQWIDNGPPKTRSHPSEVTRRFYRFVLIAGPDS